LNLWGLGNVLFLSKKPAFQLSRHLPLLKLSSLFVDTYEEAGEEGQVSGLGAAGPFWRNRRGRSVSKSVIVVFYIGKSYIGS